MFEKEKDMNRDPFTGEPGAHPVGVGIGAAGGAYAGAAAGAAVGAPAGPVGAGIGAVVGAIAGGVAGGFAGKGVAEVVNPTEVDQYWSANYYKRPYVESNETYDTYRPAYQYGYESRLKYADRSFADVENNLRSDWERTKEKSSLAWDKAKHAVRDAFDYTDDTYRARTRVLEDA